MGEGQLTHQVPFKELMSENQNRQLQGLPPTEEFIQTTKLISKFKDVKNENPPFYPDVVEAAEYEKAIAYDRSLKTKA